MAKHNGKMVFSILAHIMHNDILFFVAGPALQTGLFAHEMVSIGYDLVVIGGCNDWLDGQPHCQSVSGSFYKLSCSNNLCKWDKLPEELKTPRGWFTAMTLPDDFIECT